MAAVAADSAAQEEVAYLWPCNVQAWGVWCDLQSQWRYSGMGGASGLPRADVRAHLDELGLCGDERRDVYAGIRAAERGTLEGWAIAAKQDHPS